MFPSSFFRCGVALSTVFLGSVLAVETDDFPLNLKAVANMDFRDEIAGDGKGGWSDQGPDNDFRGFDPARRNYGGIRFAVIDPANNEGRAVLTFDSPKARTGLTTATVKVPGEAPAASYLYLLHTSCWNEAPKGAPVGKIEMTLADGNKVVHEVLNGRDIADWWGAGTLPNGLAAFTKSNASSRVGLYLSRFALPSKPVRSITFTPAGNAVWIVVAATLSSGEADVKEKTFVFTESEEWKAADMSDVLIQPGSALDLSASVGQGPAGKFGRLAATGEGNVVFEQDPGQPVRFFGYDMVTPHILKALRGATPEETKANIREFAAQVKRQGYNVIRTLALDTWLMIDAKGDGEFHPGRLDVFEYFFAALKEEGIYTYLDIGGYGLFHKGKWDEKVDHRNMKAEVFSGDPATRENWKRGATALLTRVNPHTGTALKDDPAVIAVNFYNEQELGFAKLTGGKYNLRWSAKDKADFTRLWRGWLKSRFKSVTEIADAWKNPRIAQFGSIDEMELPSDPAGTDPEGNAFGLFLHGLEVETGKWYQEVIEGIGYKGLTTQYDVGPLYREGDARTLFPLVSMHGYHAHPSDKMERGSRVDQVSSIGTLARYYRQAAAGRHWDKPFFITEHGHCFWNPYQREDGLLFASYAALQGWQALMAHENATWLKVDEPMGNFSLGRSPIGRANEFLSHQLYQRGDVEASPARVELRIEPDYLPGNINRPANSFQTRLALLTGFGVRFPGEGRPAPSREPDKLISPSEGSAIQAGDWAIGVTEAEASAGFSLSRAVASLREKGILPKGNATDVNQDIYQSDTGQITLASSQNRLAVVSPRTEGVVLDKETSADLDAFRVLHTSVPAAVAVTSVDGQPLPSSRRMVLVYLTDTVNSGMELSEDRTTLIKPGTLPPLVQTGILRVALRNEAQAQWKTWAVGFNGARREEVPVRVNAGTLEIEVNTATLKGGPVSFFEIAAE